MVRVVQHILDNTNGETNERTDGQTDRQTLTEREEVLY